MLTLKSVRNAAIGAAAVVAVFWMIQGLGAAIHWVSPQGYGAVMRGLDYSHASRAEQFAPGYFSNFCVSFTVLLCGALAVSLSKMVFDLLGILGESIVSNMKAMTANGPQ